MGWQSRTAADEPGDWGSYDWFAGLPEPAEEPVETTQRTASVDKPAKTYHEVVAAGTDWLNTDFFGEKAIAPAKRRRAPSPIPDTRLLFDVQEDFLRALTEFNRMPPPVSHGKPSENDDEYARQHKKVKTQLENGYRLMNRYLRTYVNNEVQ